MKRSIAFLLFVLVGKFALAQSGSPASYATKINEQEATKLLTVLTSDEFAGRGTGEEGARKAADFIAGEFKRLGLEAPVNGSYFQAVPLQQQEFHMEGFRLGNQTLVQGDGFYIQSLAPYRIYKSNSVVLLHSERLQTSNSTELRKAVDNQTVLLLTAGNGPEDALLRPLLEMNPALVLLVSDAHYASVTRYPTRRGRARVSIAEAQNEGGNAATNGQNNISIAYLTESKAESILYDAKTSLAALKASLNKRKTPAIQTLDIAVEGGFGLRNRLFADDNVLGFLRGEEKPDEVIVLMAHYDHEGIRADGAILRGADDNGSGTTGLMLIAQAFAEAKKNGHSPKRSILFLAVCAEEKGLLGSKYYSQNPIFPLANTVACLNMDMIGRTDDKHLNGNHNYIHVIGADKLSAELDQINREVNEKYTKMELDFSYNDPNEPQRLYYRSDHYSFAQHGVPSIFYFSGLHPHYHTPEDTLDKIIFPMLVKRAQLVYYTAWELANRDARIQLD